MEQQLGYRPALDGMRGVAIALVLAEHFHVGGLARGGRPGVTGFFVLSGFLITKLMCEEQERTGQIDLRAFYRRRAVRLLPALVILLAATWGYARLIQRVDISGDALLVLGYLGNWKRALLEVDLTGGLGHTWSLAIEEQFYVVWPLVFLLAGGVVRWRRTLSVAIGLAATSMGLLFWHWDGWYAYNATDTRVGAVLFGCALAMLMHRGVVAPDPRFRAPGVVLAMAACLPMPMAVGIAAATAAGVLLIIGFVDGSRVLERGSLLWLGRRSYALYLWHWPISLTIEPGWVALLLSLLASELSWRLVEHPVNQMARRRRPCASTISTTGPTHVPPANATA